MTCIDRRSKSNPTNGSACYVTNLSAKTLSILIAKYVKTMHMLPKDVCGYLQYGANALCRVENFTTAVPGFNSLLRGIKLVSIVSQLANGHMVLFKDNLKIDTPLFSEGIAYINCNNIPMTQSVSSLHLQSFEDDDTNYFGSAGQTSGIHEPKRRILSIA
ncbi:hypothetical protein H4I96_08297 [Botrytis cinerea]